LIRLLLLLLLLRARVERYRWEGSRGVDSRHGRGRRYAGNAGIVRRPQGRRHAVRRRRRRRRRRIGVLLRLPVGILLLNRLDEVLGADRVSPVKCKYFFFLNAM
jgi:hypothetical protein